MKICCSQEHYDKVVQYAKSINDKTLENCLERLKQWELNSSYKCNGIHINNLFKFFVWCEVSKSFTRSII